MRDRRAAQRLQRLRVFHEDGARAGGFNGAHQVGGRVARIHGGGDRAVGDDAQIGQVELEAGLGVQRDDVAFADAERAQTGGNLLGGSLVLVPGIDGVGAVGRGLAKGRGVAIGARGFFQNLVQRAGSHFKQFITVAATIAFAPVVCFLPIRCAGRYTLTTGHGDWRMMA